MDTETLCAAGEGGSRTQKEIEAETDHGSKRGEEAGAQIGMDSDRLEGRRDAERYRERDDRDAWSAHDGRDERERMERGDARDGRAPRDGRDARRFEAPRPRDMRDREWDARDLREPCLLYTSPSPRDLSTSRMPSSA